MCHYIAAYIFPYVHISLSIPRDENVSKKVLHLNEIYIITVSYVEIRCTMSNI
jgi:hypothetical protein